MATSSEGVNITDSFNETFVNGDSGHSNRTSLVSSYQKRHYGTINKGQWKANGFLTHKLVESDTLQGIALKYSIPVSEIQRFNKLFSNDSIHLHTELRIPYCSSMNSSPSSSPRLTNRKTGVTKKDELSFSLSSDEEEVKQKPLSAIGNKKGELTSSGEKNIQFLLNNVDIQLQKSRDFANKLAQKNSAIKSDGYNREPEEETVANRKSDDNDSIRDKIKRAMGRKTVWSPNNDSNKHREQVEDEIFQL